MKASYVTAGALFVESWKDRKVVNTLTTLKPKQTTVVRNIRQDAGHFVRENIVASTTISAYNSLMGGCDLGDQKASYYLRHFKSRRPYMVMFFWLFHTSVINASILHSRSRDRVQPLFPTWVEQRFKVFSAP
jgi:hypothetical protein